ncbi:MAG: hypothetical protein ACTSRA_07570, partial [Promethearchaeota archaeon]
SIDVETHDIPILDSMDLGWLENDLKRANEDNTILWIVVWFHEPMFVSFSHESRIDLRQSLGVLLDKYNVDIVLNGHCHAYQRNYPTSHDGQVFTTGDPYYFDPPYPIHIITGAGAVNEEGTTQDDLRGDDFHARWHNSSFGSDGDFVFFPSNHFTNFNITIDESTRTTRLWMDVIGLNWNENPTEGNYSAYKVDELSITKNITADWFEPPNGIEYTGYNDKASIGSVFKLISIICIIGAVDTILIISWRITRKKLKTIRQESRQSHDNGK